MQTNDGITKKKKKEKYTRYNLVTKIFQIHLEA